MDIIDVLVSLALTPQNQISSYAAMAQQAVSNANTAVTTATEASTAATSILEQFQNVTSAMDTEIKKLIISKNSNKSSAAVITNLITTYPDSTVNAVNEVVKYYTSTGNHEDGTMTQKAITQAIAAHSGGGGGGPTNLGPENAGKIVIVGPDGYITAGELAEEDIGTGSGGYSPTVGTLGLEVDYENKNWARVQQAEYLSAGADFDKYTMYGGRMRCNVADDGTINAFYGEEGYTEDGSNGQVMIYQPKFYYQRVPVKMADGKLGRIIHKESLFISATALPNFKVHPLFVDASGNELEYVLLSAYDGCAYKTASNQYDLNDSSDINFATDKLSSIAGAKPISGYKKTLNPAAAEQLANNRGIGWHIMNMAAESALQWLEVIEFGSMNGQDSLETGICDITDKDGYNCSSLTGSTASLGNATGAALSTVNEKNGVETTYFDVGKRAISYRGMENPWGNIWRMIGGTHIVGDGTQGGGVPYICTNFNYVYDELGSNYESVGFSVPASFNYISAFGYGDSKYDWVFFPAECKNANSAVPVGDAIWITTNLRGMNSAMAGGRWDFGQTNGIFTYAFDRPVDFSRCTYGARLMYIPIKNAAYTANISKWSAMLG